MVKSKVLNNLSNNNSFFNDFIVYINEDGIKKRIFVKILKISDGYVKYQTENNIKFLPWHRILKIKVDKNNNISNFKESFIEVGLNE